MQTPKWKLQLVDVKKKKKITMAKQAIIKYLSSPICIWSVIFCLAKLHLAYSIPILLLLSPNLLKLGLVPYEASIYSRGVVFSELPAQVGLVYVK